MRLHFTPSVALHASLILNLVLVAFLLGRMGVPSAAGQTSSSGDGFVMATEHTSDQMPTCFVLSTSKPHLLVYKTDLAGQLQLTSSRDLECDLKVVDSHFPRGVMGSLKTLPPVKDICRGVTPAGGKKEKVKEKDKEPEDPSENSGNGEKPGKNAKTRSAKPDQATKDN